MKPHILDVKRELVAKHVGSWVSQFFAYTKPIIGFSRSEQRLLAAALRGGTDEELSRELGISISGVKKAWRLIYQRVEDRGLDLFGGRASENKNGDRGREKKHKLLVYLREHPEELRPVSMRPLRSVR